MNPPKSFQWLTLLALFFLLVMTLYRLTSHLFLHYKLESASAFSVFLLGLRFDLRYVAICLLPAMLIGLMPGMHYFKSRTGKHLSILIFTVLTLLLLLAYSYDFITQLVFGKRLSLNTVHWLVAAKPEAKKIFTQSPWVVMLILVGVGTWLANFYAKATHRFVHKKRGINNDRNQRLFWKVSFGLLLLFLIWGSLAPHPLGNYDLRSLPPGAQQMATNPLHTLFSQR